MSGTPGGVGVRTDGELLTAIADGDRGALRELHDRNVVWLSVRLRRRCADGDAVAEAVQDTFVAVWKGAARWDGRGEPAAWNLGNRHRPPHRGSPIP